MIQAATARFYQQWHALEQSKGAKGGLVIDFDMAPRELAGDITPFADRWKALDALRTLRADAETDPDVRNRAFLRAKLAGAEAYLRGLLGERAPVEAYLSATMGFRPTRADPDALAEEKESLVRAFEARGIAWAESGRAAFTEQFDRPDLSAFEADLRGAAADLVARVRARLPDLPEPDFRVEVVETDAYWSNWIDGSVEDGVTLKVNTHKRVTYQRHSHLALAAHEIAGHACHVAGLRSAGRVDPAALNLAVHSCEAFQMEGIAQAMLHLLLDRNEIPEGLRLLERLRAWRGSRINDAWLDVEAGAPIDRVCASLQADMPLSSALSLRSGLRDRSRDPLYRCYIPVYAPSRALFMAGVALPEDERDAFLEAAMTQLWTPAQLARLVAGEDPAVVETDASAGVIDAPYRFGA